MDMTLGAFEKDDPTAASPSPFRPTNSDNHNPFPQMPQTLQYTPGVSPVSFGASYGPSQTAVPPNTNSYEPFIRHSSRSFEPFEPNSSTGERPQLGMSAPEWDSVSSIPSNAQYVPYSYPPPVSGHENDVFCGFNDTVSQQQQPYTWSQQDYTVRSTPTVSPQDLNVQPCRDYFESPLSSSSETLNPSTDNQLPSSASPTCTTPLERTQKSPAKSTKGGRPTHNMVEKQYRMRLNAHFDELLAKIPKEYLQSGSGLGIEGKNPSKTETLVMAKHYIKTLEKDAQKLSAENTELLYRFETLKAEWTKNGGVMPP